MFYLIELFVICVAAAMLDTAMTKPNINTSNKDQRILNIFTMLVLIYFAGFRSTGGSDFRVYNMIYNAVPTLEDFFDEYDKLDDYYYLFGADKGYLFINSVIKTLGFTYFGYNFLHSFVCLSLIYFCTRKYTNNFSFVILVLLYKMFFYDFCISLRQTITIAIFFFMLKDIENKHPVRYFLLCAFCYWIHAGSIVLFVVYFIRYLKLSKNTLIILNVIFIPTLVLSALNVPVLRVFDFILNMDIFGTEQIANKASTYIENTDEASINWLHTIEYFSLMFLTIWFFDDITKEFPESAMIIKLFVCLLPIFTLLRNYAILTRWKDYFTISYGFIIGYLASIRGKRYRQVALALTVLWVGFGYFRFINLFDDGAFKDYVPLRGYVRLYKKWF